MRKNITLKLVNGIVGIVLLLLSPGFTRGGIRETLGTIAEGNSLILYGKDTRHAKAAKSYLEKRGICVIFEKRSMSVNICKSDVTSDSLIKSYDILAFGTKRNNPFIRLCLEQIPMAFTDTSIIVGDSTFTGNDIRLVFTIPNPLNPEKRCLIFTAQNDKLIPGIAFGGFTFTGWDFVVFRKSDGIWYDDESICTGNFKEENGRSAIDTLLIYRKDPVEIEKVVYGRICFFYNTLNQHEAEKIARLLDTMCDAIVEEYKIQMPDKIFVYVYKESVEEIRHTGYTDMYNTFWMKKIRTTKEDFFNPKSHMIVSFAHEISRIAFQPFIDDSLKQGPLRPTSDDWCHYCHFIAIIPYVWDKLGPDAWPINYNYNKEWGEQKFKKIYKGGKDTYTYILYEIDKKYGKHLIGKVLNQITGNRVNLWVDIENFMEKLATATGDKSIMKQVKNAWPTPFEHSFWRRMEPTGIQPELADMFWDNRFVVDSVTTNSPADSVGIKLGDVIVKVNGYKVDNEKAWAHRSVLQKIQANGWLTLEIKREKAIIPYKIKIRR